MTHGFRTSSTVAPQVLHTSSTPAPQTCVSGREGKGREWKGRDVVPIHSYVRRPLGSWMVVADAPTGDIR